jgi:hypothetical protein
VSALRAVARFSRFQQTFRTRLLGKLARTELIPRDAVAGIPTDYANAVIDNTLSLLATLTTTDDLIGTWKNA